LLRYSLARGGRAGYSVCETGWSFEGSRPVPYLVHRGQRESFARRGNLLREKSSAFEEQERGGAGLAAIAESEGKKLIFPTSGAPARPEERAQSSEGPSSIIGRKRRSKEERGESKAGPKKREVR